MKRADAEALARSYALRNVDVVMRDASSTTRAQAERQVLDEALTRYGDADTKAARRRIAQALRAARPK